VIQGAEKRTGWPGPIQHASFVNRDRKKKGGGGREKEGERTGRVREEMRVSLRWAGRDSKSFGGTKGGTSGLNSKWNRKGKVLGQESTERDESMKGSPGSEGGKESSQWVIVMAGRGVGKLKEKNRLGKSQIWGKKPGKIWRRVAMEIGKKAVGGSVKKGEGDWAPGLGQIERQRKGVKRWPMVRKKKKPQKKEDRSHKGEGKRG